ncbi:retrovirus-related pol polyprotein from transposon TNT 1-94, partial [Tanacetum coccineum]
MSQENYVEGCSMQRPLFLEANGLCFWKACFETYVKSKYIDLWQFIQNNDFYFEVEDSKTKLMKENPYELLQDEQKKQLGKNNEAKMTLYNALPRKEYERVFMCKTAKENTRSSQSPMKKLLIVVSHDSTAIVTSLKSLDPDYSSKNHVRKFLRALLLKWRAKVTVIKEAKDLATLPLDELIALKAKVTREQTSDDSDSQVESDEDLDEEEKVKAFNLMARNFWLGRGRGNSFGNKGVESSKQKGVCYNCEIEGHFASECRKPKENKAFSEDHKVIVKTAMNLKMMQLVLWRSTLK